MLGIFWPENYSSSFFRQVSDTCIFYKSGVKNNRIKKSSQFIKYPPTGTDLTKFGASSSKNAVRIENLVSSSVKSPSTFSNTLVRFYILYNDLWYFKGINKERGHSIRYTSLQGGVFEKAPVCMRDPRKVDRRIFVRSKIAFEDISSDRRFVRRFFVQSKNLLTLIEESSNVHGCPGSPLF